MDVGTDTFETVRNKILRKFESKFHEYPALLLACINIGKRKHGIFLEQNDYTKRSINGKKASFEDFRSTIHHFAWNIHTRPYILGWQLTITGH